MVPAGSCGWFFFFLGGRDFAMQTAAACSKSKGWAHCAARLAVTCSLATDLVINSGQTITLSTNCVLNSITVNTGARFLSALLLSPDNYAHQWMLIAITVLVCGRCRRHVLADWRHQPQRDHVSHC